MKDGRIDCGVCGKKMTNHYLSFGVCASCHIKEIRESHDKRIKNCQCIICAPVPILVMVK